MKKIISRTALVALVGMALLLAAPATVSADCELCWVCYYIYGNDVVLYPCCKEVSPLAGSTNCWATGSECHDTPANCFWV